MYNEKLEEVGYVVSKIDRALATMKINTESQDWFFADGILIHNAEKQLFNTNTTDIY